MALTDAQLRAFVPRTNFLMDKSYLPQVEGEEEKVTTSYGIPNTTAFTGGGGGNYYPGSASNLVSNFNRDIQAYNERIKEGNRPLRPAQFPTFPGAKTPGGFDAQAMYNKASADLNDPFNRLATTQTFSGQPRPAKEVMDYADNIIDDYRMQYATGQLGPSYIEEEKPTIGRRISDFAYDYIPGINRPQSYEDIMTSGYIQPRGIIPGIMGIMSNFGLKNYASLPQADQAFIASQKGYQGPTVFGKNLGGQDPFGMNIESAFGNYAKGVQKDFDKLSGHLTKSAAGRGLTFDPVKGALVNAQGDIIDEKDYDDAMDDFAYKNKMNLTRFGFRKNQINKQKDISSDLSLIDQAKAHEAEIAHQKAVKDLGGLTTQGGGQGIASSGVASGNVDPSAMGGGSQQATSAGAQDTDRTDSGWGWADGGRVGLRYGGLLSIL